MSGKHERRRARRWVVPLLAGALASGVGLAWGLAQLEADPGTRVGVLDEPESTSSSSSSRAPDPSPSTSAPPTASPATPGRRTGHRPEAPVQVRLPSGRTVPVVPVDTDADGVLDVPDDIRTAGWWRGGARLGDPFGSTLVAAHIDSRTQGLGPYVELLRVRRGDRIVVRSAHLTQTFRVTSLRLLPRADVGRATDLFDVGGDRRLTMVTCAGPFDADRGGYQNLAVVTARPTHAPRPRAAG